MPLRLLYSFITLLFCTPSFATNVDSIASDTINNQVFILHTVEAGQGFYAIARRYGVEVKDIIDANPREGLFLEIGEIIRVPKGYIPKRAAEPVNSVHQTHLVVAGETLYSIAKLYKRKVEELRTWNSLPDNTIHAGQVLVVSRSMNTLPPPPKAPPLTNTPNRRVTPSQNGVSLVKETGMAGWIDSKYLDPQKSLALHKTAPVGTVVKITNNENSRSIYAKVIGTLPPTSDNENTIILISKSAADVLGVSRQRFPAIINYAVTQ